MKAKLNIIGAYQKLPPWGQALAFIGAGVAVWIIYSRIRGSIDRARSLRDSRQVLEAVSSDLDALAKSGIRPSYPDSQYKIWSDTLASCYSGWGTCNDADTWKAMKNDADVLKLINAFGIRKIPSGTWNPSMDFEGSLPMIVRDEHNFLMVNWINEQFKSKGIKYRF